MAIAETHPDRRTFPAGRARRRPLWTIGVTTALLAIGFTRRSAEEREVRAATVEGGRGRSADKPSDIPAPGWKDILLRVYGRISEDRIIAIAAGVTFYALLAIFPAIAALVSVYGLFSDPATVSEHVSNLSTIMPGGAIDIVSEQMNRVASQGGGTLGFAFLLGLAISLWSANAGIKALFDALNVIYDEQERRSFFALNAISLLFTLSMIAFALIAMAAIVVLPAVLGYLGLGAATEWLIEIGKWPALLAAVALIIALIYRYGPDRENARWRWITWGSAFAAFAWLVASLLFAWYAANFGSYNKTYGSLGAAIGFMTWIWISTVVVLLGATLDAEMERQTARDTTTGPPKPMGQRGAIVADTAAASP
jgi:membrane protein